MRFSTLVIFLAAPLAAAQIDYAPDFVKGRITFYDQSPEVACDIPQSEWPKYTAALSEKQFLNGLACGATARIKNGTKEIEVMVVDLCPKVGNEQWCSGDMPHFDLGGATAFGQLENVNVGVKELQIRFVSTPVGDAPVKLRLKDGINQWWFAIQVLNHRYPVAKVELKDAKSDSWTTGQRKPDLWNYWVFTFAGSGLTAPYQIRITDQYGQVIEETGNSIQEKFMWSGTHQFPVHGSGAVLSPSLGTGASQAADPVVSGIVGHTLHYISAAPFAADLVDITGKRIGLSACTAGAGSIALPRLPGAVYYIRFTQGQATSMLRWVNVK